MSSITVEGEFSFIRKVFSRPFLLPSLWLFLFGGVLLAFHPPIGAVAMVEVSKSAAVATAAALLTILALVQLFAVERRIKFAVPLRLLMVFTAGGVVLSWFFSLELVEVLVGYALAFNSVIGLIAAVLLFVITAAYIGNSPSLRRVLSILLLLCGGVLLATVVGLVFSVSDIPLVFVGDVASLTALSVLVILLAVYHLECTSLHPVLYCLTLLFLVAACYLISLMPGVSALLLAFGVLVLFAFGRVLGTPFSRRDLSLPLWPIVAITFLFLSSIVTPPASASFSRFAEKPSAPTLGDTYVVAGRAVTADVQRFLIGYGPGTFTYVWKRYQPEDTYVTTAWEREYQYGASSALTVLIEYGAIGLLLFIAFIGTIAHSLYQTAWLRTAFTLSSENLLIWCLFFLGVMQLIMLPPTALVSLLVLTTCGIAAGFGGLVYTVAAKPGKGAVVKMLAGSMACLAIVVIASANWRSVLLYQQSVVAMYEEKNAGEAYSYLEEAIALMPKAQYYRTLSKLQQDQIYILINHETDVNDADRSALKLLTSLALANAETAALRESANYLHWLVLGNMYTTLALLGAEDAVEEAKIAYNEAKGLAPGNPLPPYVLAEIYYIAGDTENALRELQYSLAVKNDYEPAFNLLSRIQLGQP